MVRFTSSVFSYTPSGFWLSQKQYSDDIAKLINLDKDSPERYDERDRAINCKIRTSYDQSWIFAGLSPIHAESLSAHQKGREFSFTFYQSHMTVYGWNHIPIQVKPELLLSKWNSSASSLQSSKVVQAFWTISWHILLPANNISMDVSYSHPSKTVGRCQLESRCKMVSLPVHTKVQP